MQGLAAVGSKRPANYDGWECQRCKESGCGINPAEQTKCDICGEPRFRLPSVDSREGSSRSLGAAHFGRQGSGSCSMSSGEDSRQSSTRSLLSEAMQTPTAAGAFNAPVESDMTKARKALFDEGCMSVKCKIGHIGTQHLHSCFPLSVCLCFSPFKENRQETLPWEACRAWDLLQEADVAAKLTLRLIFGTAADYVNKNPQSINLFFNRDPTDMLNNGEAASQSPLMMKNGLVAQQLLRVMTQFLNKSGVSDDPAQDQGLMVQTFHHIASRLQTLNAICAFCDEPDINLRAMLQPSACTRPLCANRMCEGDAFLRTTPEVLDLLVETTTLAATSARASKIFDPFPAVRSDLQDKQSELIPDPAKKSEHIELACERLKLVQNWRTVKTTSKSYHLSSGLLNWLCNSNRTHLALLPRKLHLRQVKTNRQFVMLSASPDRQRRFDQLKAQGGSTFAWYYSHCENWHRIFRHGLYLTDGLNMTTDAAVQLAHCSGFPVRLCVYALDKFDNDQNLSANWLLDKGKSFLVENRHLDMVGGPVISLSPSSYCNASESVDAGKPLQVMALCEVAKAGLDCTMSTNWTATEESVVTRLLFAFSTDAGAGNISTQCPNFDQTARDCLKNLRTFQEPISCLRDILEGGVDGYLFTPSTWPAERTMMLRATSKKIRDAIANQDILPIDICPRMPTAAVVQVTLTTVTKADVTTYLREWPEKATGTGKLDAWDTLTKISAMASSDWLTKIDLSRSGLSITVEMAGFLGRVLKQSLKQSLVHLNLAHCHIGPSGTRALFVAMQNDAEEGADDNMAHRFCSLSYLNLSGVFLSFFRTLFFFPLPFA